MADDDDKDLVEHLVENQIIPQLQAAELQEAGFDVTAGFVKVGGDIPDGWVELTCVGCGRTSMAPPGLVKPGQVAMCPACLRARSDG